MVIKRIGVGSAAKMAGVLYAAIGLIAGAIFACIALVGAGASSAAGGESAIPGVIGGFIGVGAVIVLPIMYGIFGCIGAALGAWLYNVVAGLVGGIEVEIQ